MKDKVSEALECVAHYDTDAGNLDHSHKPCLHFPECDHSVTLAQEVRRLRNIETGLKNIAGGICAKKYDGIAPECVCDVCYANAVLSRPCENQKCWGVGEPHKNPCEE